MSKAPPGKHELGLRAMREAKVERIAREAKADNNAAARHRRRKRKKPARLKAGTILAEAFSLSGPAEPIGNP